MELIKTLISTGTAAQFFFIFFHSFSEPVICFY